MICRRNKEEYKKNKILFINAKHLVTRKNSESYLEDSHINEIVSLYINYQNVDDIAKVVCIDDIVSNAYKLNINLYAKGVSEEPKSSWRDYSFEELIEKVYFQSTQVHSAVEIFLRSLTTGRL